MFDNTLNRKPYILLMKQRKFLFNVEKTFEITISYIFLVCFPTPGKPFNVISAAQYYVRIHVLGFHY